MRWSLSPLCTVLMGAAVLTACPKQEEAGKGAAPAQPGSAPAAAPASQPAGGARPASQPAAAPAEGGGAAVDKVTATIASKSGSAVTGDVTLTPTADGVKVMATIKGPKGGTHAVHIHQNADCSSDDGKSAGDHFNPDNKPHGMPDAAEKHLGDLGNVTIGEDGTAKIDIDVKGANLKTGDAHSFVGRALIVHEKADDGGQPTGNAGARVGCAELKAM
jgi:superoxide dismutase, Cu-Zn family